MGLLAKAFVFTLLTAYCFTATVFGDEVITMSEAPAPSPHHPHPHPHPKPHPHPPAYPPATPPAKPPVKPPVKPPAKPPVVGEAPAPSPHHHHHHHPHPKPHPHPHPHYPPATPPAKPPVKPPVKPPAKPPVKPPVYPPAKPPVKPPVYPPAKPPVKPPVYPPVKPPVHPPKFNRSLVAVQGVVFCKSCKYAGVDTLLDAKPVQGALVRLLCKNGKYHVGSEAKTDKNGFFFMLAPKTVTNFGFRACRVYLVKSPDAKCGKPAKLNGGLLGGVLKPVRPPAKSFVIVNKLKYGVFNTGPFAFDPVCPR